MTVLISPARQTRHAPMNRLTTFKVGGPAELLLRPSSIEEVSTIIRSEEVTLMLGGGSNLLVSDEGIAGVTMMIGNDLSNIRVTEAGDDVIVHVQAGANITKLAGYLLKRSLCRFEFAYGIPGALGGALVMNAGAGAGAIKDVIDTVTLVTHDGDIKVMTADECRFGYRSSAFPEGCVIVEAALKLKKADHDEINSRMRENQINRKRTQPLDMPSAGSIFKNPKGAYAGKLIEEAGLKGKTVGGAKISEKHANFIVNTGSAKASDVYALIRLIEKKVRDAFGISLEREVRLIGDFE